MQVLTNIWEYLSGPEIWVKIGTVSGKIAIIVILALIIKAIGNRVIDMIFKERKNIPIQLTSSRREQTLRNLLKSVLSYIISFIVIVMVLDIFGVPIGTLLAGAGVAGLAIGFGAQSLVKDIISGFFVIFEDQFSVGDYVYVSEVEGTVETIGFRTTKIQGWTGEQYVIPNGNITQVTNYSIHNGLSVVDINLPYESDIIHAEKIITGIIENLPEKYDIFTNKPEVYGVQTLDLSNYVVRVVAETVPVYHWAGERIIRKEVKEQMYKHGIEIPSQRIVLYARDKEPIIEDEVKEVER